MRTEKEQETFLSQQCNFFFLTPFPGANVFSISWVQHFFWTLKVEYINNGVQRRLEKCITHFSRQQHPPFKLLKACLTSTDNRRVITLLVL